MEEEKPKKPVVPKTYTVQDMRNLDQKDRYSAFGEMALSPNPTEPVVHFGKSTRAKREKVFQTKENMKAFLGKRA